MEQDLKQRVDDLEAMVTKLQNEKFINQLPTVARFNKNVLVAANNRFRFEPTSNVVSVATGVSIQGEQLAGSLLSGTTVITSINSHSMGNTGKWVASSNSNIPFKIDLGANTNNQYIKVGSGVHANYVILNNTTGASVDLTGIVAVEAGFEIVLLNMSAQNIVIKNDSASSSVGNKLYTLSGADVTLAQHQSIRFRYRADVIISGVTYITETRSGFQETN